MDTFNSLNSPPAPMEVLVPRLVAKAQTRGLVDGVFDYCDTPVGRLFIGGTHQGVCRIGFELEADPLAAFAKDVGPRVLPAANVAGEAGGAVGMVRQVQRELREYFASQRHTFSVKVDLRLGGFRGKVVQALQGINYGQRVSYKTLAHSVDNPGAIRAVGSACANNPIPIILPCHRVVRSDGSWGKYRGGEDAKTYLLRLEQG